ncbi:unnamed protein product [Arabidopsis halleri]
MSIKSSDKGKRQRASPLLVVSMMICNSAYPPLRLYIQLLLKPRLGMREMLINTSHKRVPYRSCGGGFKNRVMHFKYCTGSDGRGTVDEISWTLREGFPSYFKESDYKFFLAAERLERPALTSDVEEKKPESSRRQHICQIVHLGVQSNDTAFREYLYKPMIELSLANELLEYGGLDLVPFLQNAGCHSGWGCVHWIISAHSGTQISSNQAIYFDFLVKFYVSKTQHLFAAHALIRLAERRAISSGDNPALEEKGSAQGASDGN